MVIPFRPIARFLIRLQRPAPQVDLSEVKTFLPALARVNPGQGILLTLNHFSAPDFQAWWLAITISAFFPTDIHWVVTSGWENSGWITTFTHWLFPLGAKILGFTSMPSMPPDPQEIEQRAQAVRQVLQYARQASHPVVGLAPEGADTPGGTLGPLPPGVGRFIHLLTRYCSVLLPVGVWKENGQICCKFGKPYQLETPAGLMVDERDRLIGDTIMRHIAETLPEHLRGVYR